jgi:hypothetical protein
MIITARAAPMPIPAFAPEERGEEADATDVLVEDRLLVVVGLAPATTVVEIEGVVASADTVCEVGVFVTVATILSI